MQDWVKDLKEEWNKEVVGEWLGIPNLLPGQELDSTGEN